MRRAEDSLQANIIKYLRLALPKAIVYAIPNAGRRTIAEAMMMKATGLLAGMPDIGIVRDGGSAYFLEVKPPHRYLSEDQKVIAAAMETRHIPRATVRSIEEVTAALIEWRLL